MRNSRLLREIVVFLPFESAAATSPRDAAHALIDALGVEHAAIGSDILTGGVEIRLLYDAGIVEAARQVLHELSVVFEIEVR